MPIQEVTDRAWLNAALVFGVTMSKDPSRKLGACVVGANGRHVAFGYNGLPRGIPDSEKNWTRPLKYEYVIHAEENAMASAEFDLNGSTMYCALKPCHKCVGRMRNVGVFRMVWLEDEVPYALQDEDVWERCAYGMHVHEYKLDEIAHFIRETVPPHDGYK